MAHPDSKPLAPDVRHVALIPAAGEGRRMGATMPKQYLGLRGESLLEHVIRAFQQAHRIDAIAIVVAGHDDQIDPRLDAMVVRSGSDASPTARPFVFRVGGATRRDSVLNGLGALREHPFALRDHDRVLVHDAARPGIRSERIDHMICELSGDPVGGLLAMPVVDTVKRVHQGRVVTTEPRESLWLAQTPQLFAAGMLQQALSRHPEVTDEARAMELEGWHPRVLPGARGNLKVTVPDDLEWLERSWEIR